MPRGDVYSSAVQQLRWGYSHSMTNKGNNLWYIFQAYFLFDSDIVREQQAAQSSKRAWTADALRKCDCRIGKLLWERGRVAWRITWHPFWLRNSLSLVHLAVSAPFWLDCKEVGNLYKKTNSKTAVWSNFYSKIIYI